MTDRPLTMEGVRLPGGRRVEHVEVAVPSPGPGQVLLQVHASSICGSDVRAIYREHLGSGAEAYRGVIAGHEPAGEVVEVGAGCRRLAVGDRVAVYHIAGCGQCEECMRGYAVGCTSPLRAAYGWQRDGGHASFLLAEEASCLPLPERLTWVDGALAACGFGTAYEALLRIDVSGRDRLLVTGLGPVGLAAAMLGRAMGVPHVIGADVVPARRRRAQELGLVDAVVAAEAADAAAEVSDLTGGQGCEAVVDASGSPAGRLLALHGTRRWGRCVFVGEGGDVSFPVSELLIHRQVQLHGSWVTSIGHLADLLDRLVRWELHPQVVVTHRLPLSAAAQAYRLADEGEAGKVCLIP